MQALSKFLLIISLLASWPTHPMAYATYIKERIKEHKTAALGLAGLLATGAITHQLLATDYGATDLSNRDIYWDWGHIDTSVTKFPSSFLFGVGTSAYQVEGNCTNTDWHDWEQQVDAAGNPRVEHPAGAACDHWNRYKEDIGLIEEIGAGIYRFSLAWDKIQPTADTFDEAALAHYHDVCRELKAHNIKILIGLHHYADPKWFADMGGFEHEENIAHFVKFCTKVFQSFHDQGIEVDLWTVFNSPSGYAFHKYHVGDFPPGIKGNKQLTLTVFKNMLEAHVQVYQQAKKISNHFTIGLLKNIIHIDPYRSWHPLDKFACDIARIMTDDCMINFFKTGIFKAKIPFDATPFMANVEHVNLLAPYSFDFVGLNCYSHSYIKNMNRLHHPQEIVSDNPTYTIYPESLYRGIVRLTNELCKPIEELTGRPMPLYVTENGVACKETKQRELFFKQYLYAIYKAISDGYDVKGYIYWALMDNYEWGSYNKKGYGIFHIDFEDPTLTRTIKTDPGTEYFISLMKKNKENARAV